MIRSYRSRRLCRLISSSPFPSLLYYSLLLFFLLLLLLLYRFQSGNFFLNSVPVPRLFLRRVRHGAADREKRLGWTKKEKGKRRVDGSFGNEKEVCVYCVIVIDRRAKRERAQSAKRERERGP